MASLIKKNDTKTIILFAATILWMAVIYYFSSQPANTSAEVSGKMAVWLLERFEYLYKGTPPKLITDVILSGDHYVRKGGHVFEYMVLGGLVAALVRRLNFKRCLAISIIICLLYAISDEIHQMFVPGRGPLVSDVFLDLTAAVIGMLFVKYIHFHI